MKRILTVQDISCVGKCSLTVALPIISAAGIETAVLPTAVLSNHTAFDSFTFRDLTGDMQDISDHWKAEHIGFDAIYTGYLGSEEQIGLVHGLFHSYRTDTGFILVDPAMADNGKLYPGFTPAYAKAMAGLCSEADMIVPNLTEACILLGEEYKPSGYSRDYIRDILKKLTDRGPREAALTGISFENGKLGTVSYDRDKDCYFEYFNRRTEQSFHGTGDIFASALLGAIENDKTTEEALQIAVDYTLACIICTLADEDPNWYGVNFEEALPEYMRLLGKVSC